MGIRYMVTRGDNLWGLAGRYLGDFNRWREIWHFHNDCVQKSGKGDKALILITDPDLIYVGQVLMIPGRDRRPAATAVSPGPKALTGGQKAGSDKFGVPLNLKTELAPRAPIRYGPYTTPDYTMFSELSGKIVLENMNPDRHRNNWELAISDDENIVRRKLKQQYDKAFVELTADMGMTFDPASRMATIKPRIAAKAGLGPYTFAVEADSPTHFSYTLELNPMEGSLDLAGRRYLVNDGGTDSQYPIYAFHHEFSSLLLNRHGFFLNPWFEQNPKDFKYREALNCN